MTNREEPGAFKHCPGGNPSYFYCILRNGNYSSSTFSQRKQVEKGLNIAYLLSSDSKDAGCERLIIAHPTAGPHGLHVPSGPYGESGS